MIDAYTSFSVEGQAARFSLSMRKKFSPRTGVLRILRFRNSKTMTALFQITAFQQKLSPSSCVEQSCEVAV
jgi:hypothetical protein